MESQMLHWELASARAAELERIACRARTQRDPSLASHGALRRRAGRLLIDVGRRLADDG